MYIMFRVIHLIYSYEYLCCFDEEKISVIKFYNNFMEKKFYGNARNVGTFMHIVHVDKNISKINSFII